MKRLILCLLLIMVLIGVVSADTLLVISNHQGYLYNQDSNGDTWANLRAAAGTGVVNSGFGNSYYWPVLTAHSSQTNKYIEIGRMATTFNTSTIGSGSTIDNGTFRLLHYSNQRTLGGTSEVCILQGSPVNPLSYVAGDYDAINLATVTELGNRVDYSGLGSNEDMFFTLNAAGKSAINKTGFTVIYTIDGDECDNSFSGTWGASYVRRAYIRSLEHSTEAYRPYLEIGYTIGGGGGDTTPPASITSFSSNSVTCTEENITWVNPPDADFNHTQMYKDNVWQINETNTTTFHKFTGLNSWQSYTYSTHTCDLTGNCNTTWVNQTVATSPICKIINYIRQFYLPAAVIT
jgi:hypothetical protein